MLRLFIFLGSLVFLVNGQAHPVSFQSSIGVMGEHSSSLSHIQLNYSYRHWVAFGYHHYKRPSNEDNLNANFVSGNFLLHRWNGSAFQANLYGVLGVGTSELSGTARSAGLSAIQFDVEDRKYYFLAKHRQVFTEKGSDLIQSTLRAGIAPYVEKYSGIHSWLILEVQRREFSRNFYGDTSSEKQATSTTPFLRIFYRNVLFEIGQSFAGETRFNYISHF